MSQLESHICYFILKCAGDNTGGEKVDMFVATNHAYFDCNRACEVAHQLAMETPGNRYYVVKSICGYMSHTPSYDFVDYTDLATRVIK